jgi:hypothetical protein
MKLVPYCSIGRGQIDVLVNEALVGYSNFAFPSVDVENPSTILSALQALVTRRDDPSFC